MPPRDPSPIDRNVGQKLRDVRRLHKMSQTELAKQLGLSFQQVQKYEQGSNRISAGRLYDLAVLFNVEIGYFFDDVPLPDARLNAMKSYLESLDETTADIIEALIRINNEAVSKKLRDFVVTLAQQQDHSSA